MTIASALLFIPWLRDIDDGLSEYISVRHVHIARNLGSVAAEVWVTYTGVPAGGAFRIDAEDPGC
ncbi:MAG: hypothetical protein ACRDMW_10750 [Gaiellaceae bacterium]